MSIIFHHPPTRTVNPLTDFEPWNPLHYPGNIEAGLYIYGIRAKVHGKLKFIPLVVGESMDLRKRLFEDHYNGKYVKAFENLIYGGNRPISERKEIWNFSKCRYDLPELRLIYGDMAVYNSHPRGRKLPPFLTTIATLQQLLYFQNVDLYNYRFILTEPIRNIRSDQAIRLLMEKSGDPLFAAVKVLMQLNAANLILTLKNFNENFYFVYASHNNQLDKENLPENQNLLISDTGRRAAEHQLKDKLKNIHIHTTADSKNIKNSCFLQFDISKIQNELVNVGGHPYNDSTGNYKTPLILK
jgi:hypothetical protein